MDQVVSCALVVDQMVCHVVTIAMATIKHTLGKVYGEIISRKEEDNIRLIIDDTIKRFHPFVSPSNYRYII